MKFFFFFPERGREPRGRSFRVENAERVQGARPFYAGRILHGERRASPARRRVPKSGVRP